MNFLNMVEDTAPVALTMTSRPLASLVECSQADANHCLVTWGHKMGALHRGNQQAWCYALLHGAAPVAVLTVSILITPRVASDYEIALTRENTCELSRLAASRPDMNRVMLRLWRSLVFPVLNFDYAISYQDADLHTGNTYRFDGWKRIGFSSSGTDSRSGRKGRRKYIWLWGGK